jgi:DDE superfamily endonuclease
VRALDLAVAGEEGCRTRHRRARQRQHDRAGFKKNELKPHLKTQWVIPPEANGAFVAAMEDVLFVYTRPHDPDRPLVCLDETTKQLTKENADAGADAETATGTARLRMRAQRYGQPVHDVRAPRRVAPREGDERRTAIHYANVLKDLSDVHFPGAKTIVLVQDNLNTHTPASLYEAFPAPEARRLVERFEWHYTPKHGSWLERVYAPFSPPRPARRLPAYPPLRLSCQRHSASQARPHPPAAASCSQQQVVPVATQDTVTATTAPEDPPISVTEDAWQPTCPECGGEMQIVETLPKARRNAVPGSDTS